MLLVYLSLRLELEWPFTYSLNSNPCAGEK